MFELGNLNRGHTLRWLLIYAPCVWILLQVADIVLDSFGGAQHLMRLLILGAVAGVPLVAIASVLFGSGGRTVAEAPADTAQGATDTRALSLAVLPFQCLSEEPADAWYGSVLTDDLIALISRDSQCSVVARSSVSALERAPDDLPDIGRRLDVRYILDGSLRRNGEDLRVTARLVDSCTGTHLWSGQYDRPAADFGALMDELCQAIALRLGIELTRAEFSSARTRPPAQCGAWELYQQAKGRLQFSGWSTETFRDTEDLLRRALALDPELAPAHAYLALILALAHWTSFYKDHEYVYSHAMAHIDRAMALAPDSSEVLGFAGCALSDLGHPERGIPVMERAVEINPANAQAHAALGTANILSGRVDLGIAQLEHAVRISPADPGLAPWSTVLSVVSSSVGDAETGLAWANRAVQADSRYFAAHLALALAYTAADQPGRAGRCLAEACRLSPTLDGEAISRLLGAGNWQRMLDAGIVP